MSVEAWFNPMAIVEAFNRYDVDYVVIGGFAAELHQAPVEATRDIDFTPSTTDENLARVSAALSDLDARIRTEAAPEGLPFSHDGASLGRVGVWNLTSDFGDFDLSFKPSGTEGYGDLVRNALRLDVDGQIMPVASLADVIRSKEAAGRQKDARALPGLLQRLRAQEDTPLDDQLATMGRRAVERINAVPPPPTDRPGPQPPASNAGVVRTPRNPTVTPHDRHGPPLLGQRGPTAGS